jgi:hypothetical protein
MRAWGWLLGLALGGQTLFAQNELLLVLTEENDSFINPWGIHPDRHYTQGLKAVVLLGPHQFTGVSGALDRWLSPWGFQTESAQVGWVLVGQHIYTPGSITVPEPILDDRPYAGWLYTGPIFQRRGHTPAGTPVFENWELDLGVVGPASLADQSQGEVHRRWFPDYVPLGWSHQLHNEFGLELKYGRRWRCLLPGIAPRFADVLPQVGASIGNVRTHVNAGAFVRAGWNLPDDFGPVINESTVAPHRGLSPATPWIGAHVFAGVEGRVVARDLFLDGNTFGHSQRVAKYPFTADLVCGVAAHLGRFVEVSYTRVVRTKQFYGQRGLDHFASITGKLTLTF